jgi:alginate O-acetyltransferase complex protein AlgI
VWGLLHGLFLLLENHGLIPAKKDKLKHLLHIYTLLVVIVTFVIFRADSLTQGVKIIGDMFKFSLGDAAADATVYALLNGLVLVSFAFGVMLSMPVVPYIKGKLSKTKAYPAAEYAGYTGTLVIFALCVLSLVSSTYNPFIYFRF